MQKKKICYNDFKEYISNDEEFTKKVEQKFKSWKQTINYEEYEPKNFQNSEELINLLEENNEFFLTNYTISLMLSEGKNEEINYEINSKNLIINLNSDNIFFKHNSNIINKNSLINVEKEKKRKKVKIEYIYDKKKIKLLIA